MQLPDQATPLPVSGGPDGDVLPDGEVLPILLRYRDRYRWSWNLSTRLINLYYGTHYTEKQLKSLYRKNCIVS